MADELLHALEARTRIPWVRDGEDYRTLDHSIILQRVRYEWLLGLPGSSVYERAWPWDADPWDLADAVGAILSDNQSRKSAAQGPALPGME